MFCAFLKDFVVFASFGEVHLGEKTCSVSAFDNFCPFPSSTI